MKRIAILLMAIVMLTAIAMGQAPTCIKVTTFKRGLIVPESGNGLITSYNEIWNQTEIELNDGYLKNFVDSSFHSLGLDAPALGKESVKIQADIKFIHYSCSASLMELFTSLSHDLNSLCMTQGQIAEFFIRNKVALADDITSKDLPPILFFLTKDLSNNYFIFVFEMCKDGTIFVCEAESINYSEKLTAHPEGESFPFAVIIPTIKK